MSTGLLYGCDEAVANFVFSTYCRNPMQFDRAIGLVDKHGMVVGGILFQGWNGPNVEMSYYGEQTLTPGVVRSIANFVIATFNPSRGTVNTRKRNKRLIRALLKMGFKLEGVSRRYYGDKDCAHNTAVRLVLFRERIEQIAGVKETLDATRASA